MVPVSLMDVILVVVFLFWGVAFFWVECSLVGGCFLWFFCCWVVFGGGFVYVVFVVGCFDF